MVALPRDFRLKEISLANQILESYRLFKKIDLLRKFIKTISQRKIYINNYIEATLVQELGT